MHRSLGALLQCSNLAEETVRESFFPHTRSPCTAARPNSRTVGGTQSAAAQAGCAYHLGLLLHVWVVGFETWGILCMQAGEGMRGAGQRTRA